MPRTTKKLTCPHCGKVCNAQGLVNHIRLKHKLKIKEQIVEVQNKQEVEEIVTTALQGIITPSLEEIKPLETVRLDKPEDLNAYNELKEQSDNWQRQQWERLKASHKKYGAWVPIVATHYHYYRKKFEPDWKP